MVKLSEVFAAAGPTALAKAKLLPQLCASQDWLLGKNPEGCMPAQRGFAGDGGTRQEPWRRPSADRR